jgi:hypothetical protein
MASQMMYIHVNVPLNLTTLHVQANLSTSYHKFLQNITTSRSISGYLDRENGGSNPPRATQKRNFFNFEAGSHRFRYVGIQEEMESRGEEKWIQIAILMCVIRFSFVSSIMYQSIKAIN